MVVLWGARRGDRQFGGAVDRQMEQIKRDLARLHLNLTRELLGMTTAEALTAVRRFVAAMREASR